MWSLRDFQESVVSARVDPSWPCDVELSTRRPLSVGGRTSCRRPPSGIPTRDFKVHTPPLDDRLTGDYRETESCESEGGSSVGLVAVTKPTDVSLRDSTR